MILNNIALLLSLGIWMREATDPRQMKYLDSVLEILFKVKAVKV